jgi:hypothetical protein
MKRNSENKYQIHLRADEETRKQWLTICDTLKGNTQSAVFRKLITNIYNSILEISNIEHHEATG